jgi:hypothetical protein
MPGQTLRCAYCGEPLVLTPRGVNAWRVDVLWRNPVRAKLVADECIADAPELQLPPPLKIQVR